MRSARVVPFMIVIVGLALGGCGLPGLSSPTQAPLIVIASPTPAGNAAQPTASPQATSAAQPTASPQATSAAQPTAPVQGPAPTVPAGSPSKGTVTFAFDAFPTYYPGIVAEVKGLLKQRGYDLKLVPFGLEGQAPSEEQRWAKLKSGEWDVLATTLD